MTGFLDPTGPGLCSSRQICTDEAASPLRSAPTVAGTGGVKTYPGHVVPESSASFARRALRRWIPNTTDIVMLARREPP
jgi:hypothetical protein